MFSQGQSRDSKPCCSTITVTRHCPPEMRQRSSWSIDQFVMAKKLGGGYASTVHLAICKATGIQVAIKVYHRCKLSQLNNYQVHREIRIHSCLDHKNVLQLYAAFEDEVGVYLVAEYASRGDVFGELDRRGGSMTEADAVCQVLSPFLSALEYLHMLNIIHRDIKPENLLFTATGVLKVADFGLSIDITQERPVTRVGTLDYMAPEVVICPDKCHPNDHKEKTHLHYTYLVDAWAVGVLAYELTVGRAPFDAGHKRGTIDNILHSSPRFPAWTSDGCRHFVTWSLTKDSSKRPGIQQLGEHPWIHQHAGSRPKAAVNPGRAVSFHNLSMYVDPGSKSTQQHVPRVKMAEAPSCEALAEEDEVFVSATGEGDAAPAAAAAMEGVVEPGAAAGAVNAGSGGSSSSSSSKPPLPGGAVAVPAGNTVTTESPTAVVSPFASAASQAAPVPLSPGSSSLLGAAADKLRAFVHRCQSANDIEGLRAFMMMQPPEPSNACFEPGGRFYTGPSAQSSQQQLSHGSSSSAATAAVSKHGMSGHDSAASLGCHFSKSSSSSCSRPADLPRAPSSGLSSSQQHQQQSLPQPLLAAGFATPLSAPKPLQLVKLPPPSSMARSDSCKSLQGLGMQAAGPGEREEGSPTATGSLASLKGAASCSPMAVSPAAHRHDSPTAGQQQLHGACALEQLGPERPSGASCFSSDAAAAAAAGGSTSSCSSCESATAACGSVSSCHSWGFQCLRPDSHSPEVQPPTPPSPPCLSSKVQSCIAFSGPAPTPAAPAPAPAGPAPPAASAAAEPSRKNAGSCHDMDQLINVCRPGHAVPVGASAAAAAMAAGRPAVVSLTADCRAASAPVGDQQLGSGGPGLQQQQQQHLLQAAGDVANSCFGFLKTARR